MQIGISDFSGLGAGSGNMASQLLANNMNVDCLRPFADMKTNEHGGLSYDHNGNPIITGNWMNSNGDVRPVANATLRKEEWLEFDTVATDIQRGSLVGVADLNARGLTRTIGNGLGTTVLESQTVSDQEAAEMTMTGRSRGRSDTAEFTSQYLPLPIVHAGFDLDIRQLNSSRRLGTSLDTTNIETRSRRIADFLENLLFNGVTGNFAYGGGNIYGYRTHPNRLQKTISNWASASALTIIEEILAMKQQARDLFFKGPFMLYIPTAFSNKMDEDYHSGTSGWNGGKTIRERIRQIDGILDVKEADSLTAGSVVLVQMTSNVVRMVNGLPLRTVEWNVEGGMVTHFKLMTIQIPQIRADANSSCGIVHGSV